MSNDLLRGVRMVATDIDGTLLRSDYTISERTQQAIRMATAAGVPVVFVTGRPPRWLDEIAALSGHTGVAVSANGAVLYDLATAQIVASAPLHPPLLAEITSVLRGRFTEVVFGFEYGLSFAHEPEYRHDWEISPLVDRAGNPIAPPVVGPLAEIIRQPAVKLLAKDRTAVPDEFMQAAASLLTGRCTVTHSSRTALLEISAFGVTKATGLEQVARSLGIDRSEVAVIGDMPNDLPMYDWAGHTFAVANAHPAVLAAADHVVASNDNDAVAQLIESVLTARGD
jgi:Cof subfamily protein (haloacid dehalogenase superfamily)